MTEIYALIGFALGAVVAFVIVKMRTPEAKPEISDDEAKKILDVARAEADVLKKAAVAKGKERAFQLKKEFEGTMREKRGELAKQEEIVKQRENVVEKRGQKAQRREEDVIKKEDSIIKREQAAEAKNVETEETLNDAKLKLEQVAGLTAADAKQQLMDAMLLVANKEAAIAINKIEAHAAEEATEKAKKIICTAIQRYAGEYVGERTVSIVPIPSDDMKGRLIGREGRNVRALEAATGIDLIIDDTPECITISCFNPVRREVARLAIGRLVSDGRIHPTRIEEVVGKCEKEVAGTCKDAGEQAVFDLGLHRVHPEVVKRLGSLKLRSSYAQNLLTHSIEVGFLAGVMAEELGISVKQARRAGLFHDIGKAVDHEVEGPHAKAGAEFLRKHGESPRVCQAVASHHEDSLQNALLDHVVDAANRLSGHRPGARREQLATYVKRLYEIEDVAKSFDAVQKVFAIQAGRELRVIVDNAKISDDQAVTLSKDIARKIEEEMTYAGQVRVCVLRETRSSEYAR